MSKKSDYEIFEEFLKECGYKRKSEVANYEFDPSAGASENMARLANLDMQGGFQDITPMNLLILAEVVANAIAQRLPLNVLNSYGNFIELVGQAIATFNAQQQYQQSGPGRCYNEAYRNVTNPFVITSTSQTQSDGGEPVVRRRKKVRDDEEIKKLRDELEKLKRRIDKINN